jgi:hypothetical protein
MMLMVVLLEIVIKAEKVVKEDSKVLQEEDLDKVDSKVKAEKEDSKVISKAKEDKNKLKFRQKLAMMPALPSHPLEVFELMFIIVLLKINDKVLNIEY